MTEPNSVTELLRSRESFLLVTHQRPDGDAFGSTIGLALALRARGKTVKVLLPDPIPANYTPFLPSGIDSCLALTDLSDIQCTVALDSAASTRLGLGQNLRVDQLPHPLINIDHHPDNKLFGDINHVRPDCAAASEIIVDVIQSLGWSIDSNIATALLLGLIMDTGSFRFDNTSSQVLASAGILLDAGARHHQIIQQMFFSKPLEQILFEAELLQQQLRCECSGRYAWAFIPDDLLEKHGIDLANTESLIDAIRAIRGVVVAALLVNRDGAIKFSLRSKSQDVSVGVIARRLNGGGHELAAGGLIETQNVAEAEQVLLALVEEALGNTP